MRRDRDRHLSWTGVRAAGKCVGIGCGVVPTHCPHNNMKGVACSFMSWHSSSPSSLKCIFGTRRDGLCSLLQRRRSVFLWPRPLPQGRPCAWKGRVGEVLRCCPGLNSSAPLEVYYCAKSAWMLYFFASTLSSCGVCSKILHCICLAMCGKNTRDNRWFRQARQLLLTACGRMAK